MVRRVVVTPTFAAGLGIVAAAVFAYQMGGPSFRVTIPHWAGQRCTTPGCALGPQHAGRAAVKGGQKLRTHAGGAHAGTPSARPTASPGAAGPTGTRPVVTYQSLNTWPSGFQGSLTLSFAHGRVPRHWGLRFSYPSGRVQRIWGMVRWQPEGVHSVLVTPPGWHGLPEGHDIQIWFEVDGHAGRPHGCSFDRTPCNFR